MRNLKTYLLAFAALAFAGNVFAQSATFSQTGLGVSGAISAVSTDVGLYVKYVGASQTGTATVEVAAGGDLTFTVNGAADSTIKCPSGGSSGVIDVSDADCNTMGEVLDVINKTSNWRGVLGAMLRSDSSNDTLITRSAAVASGPHGVSLLKDTAVALNITLDLTPNYYSGGRSMSFFFNESPNGPSAKLNPNPFNGLTTLVTNLRENITSSGTVGQFIVYGVTQTHSGVGTSAYVNSETVRTIWSETGASTGTQLIPGPFNAFPLYGVAGERILVRISATTDLTVPLVNAAGIIRKYNQQQY